MYSHYGNGLQYSGVGLAMHSHNGNGLQITVLRSWFTMHSHYGNSLQYSDVGLAMHSHCGRLGLKHQLTN